MTDRKKDIWEYKRKRECTRECSKCSWTNRWGEAGKYICYPRHYGARSSFLIEIPSYFQPARVTWTPNPRFDAISLSLRSKCEKWNIFIGRTASVDHTSKERYYEQIRVRDILISIYFFKIIAKFIEMDNILADYICGKKNYITTMRANAVLFIVSKRFLF